MAQSRQSAVEYVLFSEFDIDRGSTLRAQAPVPTTHATHALAEAMLPEGAHKRDEDWTVFSLRGVPAPEHPRGVLAASGVSMMRYSEGEGDWTSFSAETVHVVVVAWADGHGVWHGELRVFTGPAGSPDAEDADEITRAPVDQALEVAELRKDFFSVYVGDTAWGMRFGSETDGEAFGLVVNALLEHKMPEDVPELKSGAKVLAAVNHTPGAFYYCINLVCTRRDATARRGAVVKALALVSPFPWVHVFRPLLLLAMQKLFDVPDDSRAVMDQLLAAAGGVTRGDVPQLSPLERAIVTCTGTPPPGIEREHIVRINWDGASIPVRIPLIAQVDDVGETALVSVVRTFQSGIIHILDAVLSGRRVLFLGHEQPAASIVQFVLSVCAMVAPPLSGIVRHRAFPYVTLISLDEFLAVPGFIAGTTNRIFAEKDMWWDVLCDMDAGTVRVKGAEDQRELDRLLLDEDRALYAKVWDGVESHMGEEWVVAQFRAYTQHFVDMCVGDAIFESDAAREESMGAFAPRMQRFTETNAFARIDKEHKKKLTTIAASDFDFDIGQHVRRLRVHPHLTNSELHDMLTDIHAFLQVPENTAAFLRELSVTSGGLYPVAVTLYASDAATRALTRKIIAKLDSDPQTSHVVSNLNMFFLLPYHSGNAEDKVLPRTAGISGKH